MILEIDVAFIFFIVIISFIIKTNLYKNFKKTAFLQLIITIIPLFLSFLFSFLLNLKQLTFDNIFQKAIVFYASSIVSYDLFLKNILNFLNKDKKQ